MWECERMTNDPDDLFDPAILDALRAPGAVDGNLLAERQFTSHDVMQIVGITDKQLEHVVDPKRAIVPLTSHEYARLRGVRRLFSGGDVLKIATVFAVNDVGFPQKFMATLANTVMQRTMTVCDPPLDLTPNLMIATWPMKSGEDWALSTLHANRTSDPKLPVACILIDVDRLIRETVAKLEAVVEGRDIPNFDIPDPVPEPSPYFPENDFFRAWTKDSEGRDCRVGLTFEETQEYNALAALDHSERTFETRDRYLELVNRHEAERQDRLSREAPERIKEFFNPDRPS